MPQALKMHRLQEINCSSFMGQKSTRLTEARREPPEACPTTGPDRYNSFMTALNMAFVNVYRDGATACSSGPPGGERKSAVATSLAWVLFHVRQNNATRPPGIRPKCQRLPRHALTDKHFVENCTMVSVVCASTPSSDVEV